MALRATQKILKSLVRSSLRRAADSWGFSRTRLKAELRTDFPERVAFPIRHLAREKAIYVYRKVVGNPKSKIENLKPKIRSGC
jgi:hypothetical protein